MESSVQKPETRSNYVIRLDVFEGPLDLLLHLIEREELEITSIAIAQVTDQFLMYIEHAEDVPPALLADFVAMAARLLQIKSRALLPAPSAASEEDDEDDPGEALARQLRAYKQFREIAKLLSEREREHLRAYVRVAPYSPGLQKNIRLEAVTLEDLVTALKRVLEEKSETADITVVTPYTVTIHDKITELRHLLRRKKRLDFMQLLQKATHRQEVIVSFMAVLELLKQGEIRVYQDSLFAPIVIEQVAVQENSISTAGTEPMPLQ